MKSLAIGLTIVPLLVGGSASPDVRVGACCPSHPETRIPLAVSNAVDWAAFAVSLSDSEISHFHNRAKELINSQALWKRFGKKYEAPFEIATENFQYECERLVKHKATVAVIVPIKKQDFHDWFVKIVFRQYYKDDPEAEVESIALSFWP